jgi:hypothetical protein
MALAALKCIFFISMETVLPNNIGARQAMALLVLTAVCSPEHNDCQSKEEGKGACLQMTERNEETLSPPDTTAKQAYPATEHLQGIVERVTFHSEESGYTVARFKVPSVHDLITIVGSRSKIGRTNTKKVNPIKETCEMVHQHV